MNNQNRFSTLFGIIFGIIGLIFFGVGLVCLYVSLNAIGDEALALRIVGSVFSVLGGSFIIISTVSLRLARNQKRKIERLMSSGICYDGEIVRIYENFFMNINFRHPFILECTYKDMQGKTYLVKSGNIWLSYLLVRESDIKAKVWVNPDNPKDYFVEVCFGSDKDNANIKYDYDYR